MILFIVKVWLVILAPVIIFWLILYMAAAYFSRKRSKMESEYEQTAFREEGIDTNAKEGLKNKIISMLSGLEKYLLVRTRYIPSHTLRNMIYKYVFRMKIDKTAKIRYGCVFKSPEKIVVGEGSIIGDNCNLDAREGILIGKNVNFSSEVSIWTLQHDTNSTSFACKGGKVIIGDRAWISNRCIILPGVNIGEGCVIAANAVVTKDTLPFSVYAGVPAKKIAERNNDLVYDLKSDKRSFFY